MKKMKRIASLVLALAIMMMFAVPAMAASITVDNAVAGETYNAYKIFDVTQSGTSFAYSIDGSNSWKADVEGFTYDFGNGVARPVFTMTASAADANKFVVTPDPEFENNDTAAAAFAEYLKGKLAGKTATASETASDAGVAMFENLDAGYYFMDTSLGALCALQTTGDSRTLKEKNSEPDLKKEVKEDSDDTDDTDDTYGPTATLDMVDDAEYKLTITVGKGVEKNYVITDTLPKGFTYNDDIEIAGFEEADYSVTAPTNDGQQVLTITLYADKLRALTAENDAVVTITYSAAIGEDAKLDDVAGTLEKVNTNKAVLKFENEDKVRGEDEATVFLFKIEGIKVDAAAPATKLPGAKFILSKGTGDDREYAKIAGGKLTGWGTKEEADELVTGEDGKLSVEGLDADTYYLTETEAPAGYNMLTSDITVVITANTDETTGAVTATYTYTNNAQTDSGELLIGNSKGSLLPSTGGIGTTIFYVIGGILVIGAGVVLVSKKRMGARD